MLKLLRVYSLALAIFVVSYITIAVLLAVLAPFFSKPVYEWAMQVYGYFSSQPMVVIDPAAPVVTPYLVFMSVFGPLLLIIPAYICGYILARNYSTHGYWHSLALALLLSALVALGGTALSLATNALFAGVFFGVIAFAVWRHQNHPGSQQVESNAAP